MTILSPSVALPLRQTLVTGRASVRFTEAALDVTSATLAWENDGKSGRFAANFHAKTGGYFAFALDPTQAFPTFTPSTTVTLSAQLTLRNGSIHTLSAAVPAADLSLMDDTATLAGKTHSLRRLAQVPVNITLTLDPDPVRLDGLVLESGDPNKPMAGVSVTVAGLGPYITDSDGRFRSAALPLSASASVSLTHDGETTTQTQPLDYSAPLNAATYSITPPPPDDD